VIERDYIRIVHYLDLWRLFAGLGMFQFGMNLLEQALKNLIAKRFCRILQHSTDKPNRSVFGGLLEKLFPENQLLIN